MMFKIFIAADDYNFGAQMFKTTVTFSCQQIKLLKALV